jgi:hypothetical protein
VFFVGELADADTLPDDSVVSDWVDAHCLPAFERYTGRAYGDDPDIDISWFSPLAAGWLRGDREVTCFAIRTDEGDLTESLRAD